MKWILCTLVHDHELDFTIKIVLDLGSRLEPSNFIAIQLYPIVYAWRSTIVVYMTIFLNDDVSTCFYMFLNDLCPQLGDNPLSDPFWPLKNIGGIPGDVPRRIPRLQRYPGVRSKVSNNGWGDLS